MSRRGENIYKRADGRYEGRYIRARAPNGRAVYGYIYGTRYTEVKLKLAEKRTQYAALLRDPIRPTPRMCAWAAQWKTELASCGLKGSTLRKYEQMLENHILPAFGKMEIGRIDRRALLDFADRLRSKGLSDTSIRNVLQLTNRLLKDAVSRGILSQMPDLKNLMPPVPENEYSILSEAELGRLTAFAGEQDLPVLLCLLTGLRVGEICGLRWMDFDGYHRTLTVRQTVQRLKVREVGRKTDLVAGRPKTPASCRIIPLPEPMAQKLEAYQKQDALPEDYIFGERKKPMDPRTLQRRFQRLLRRAGIPPVCFHCLRHTFTTRIIELGTDVKTVSALLGHSSVRTTLDIYTHCRMKSKRKAIEKLAKKII